MSFQRQKQLVEQLFNKSRKGDLKWQESANAGAFQVSFSHYTVIIYTSQNYEGAPTRRLEIINAYGKLVESFDDEDLTLDGPRTSEGWFGVMTEILELARRNALGVDKALDDILSEITA